MAINITLVIISHCHNHQCSPLSPNLSGKTHVESVRESPLLYG